MQIRKLIKKYQDAIVLNIDCLSLDSGLVHGLLGANGAGKSTLIKIVMGLVHADSRAFVTPDNISLLPENPYLPLNLTAFQIVRHACRVQSADIDVELLLQEVGLKESAWHKVIRTYSKGMKQRTSIAYALAGKPKWLVLDEPMSGLDAMGRKRMLDIFKKRKEDGVNILMCSHSVTDLVRLCDKVHIMDSGKICETKDILNHSMGEAETLESRLIYWSSGHAVD